MPDLVFTNEELTLLANLAGAAYFPCTGSPVLDDATRVAVGRGLIARGVLRDDEPPVAVEVVQALLNTVLHADRSLWLTVRSAGGDDDRYEVVWLRDGAVARHRPSYDGTHRLLVYDRSAVDDLLAVALRLDVAPDAPSGEPHTVSERVLLDALELNASQGTAAARERAPELAGYLDALSDMRRETRLEARRHLDGGGVDSEELTLIESPGHGLWVVRELPASGAVTVQRTSVASAREQATRLVRAAG